MKIAHFIDTDGPGGAETIVLQLSRVLVENGYSVVILCFGNEWLRHKCALLNIEYIQISSYKLYKKNYTLPLFSTYLMRELKKNRIEVLHSHLFGPVIAGSMAARLAGIHHVGTLHDSYTLVEKPVRLYLLAIASFLGTYLAVVSEIMKNNIAELNPRSKIKYHVITNGVDKPACNTDNRGEVRASIGLNENEFVVLHVGRLVDIKRQDLIIKSLSLLNEKLDIRLVIAGDGPNENKLKTQIFENELQNKIILLGHRDDIGNLMLMSDCFILASDSEGMSCSIIEAMLMGLPAIVTRVGGNSELVEDGKTGYLVEKGNYHEIAEKVELLAMRPELRDMMSTKAEENAQNYHTMERTAKDYMNIYQGL